MMRSFLSKLFYNSFKPLSKNFIEKVCTSNLEKFTLSRLTEDFNFEEFLAEIQKKKPKLDVRLFFKKNYKMHERVNAYMEELLDNGLTDSCPPLFEFGINENDRLFINRLKLKHLRNSYLREFKATILID
uniref:Uncharacterized protein n=1 Tax=Panagrolaimus davidi TaxID=227884 RepID=A0A914Q592_9BILA